MNDHVKEFLLKPKNWKLLENKEFDELYSMWFKGKTKEWMSVLLTEALLEVGINPLNYFVDEIPRKAFYGLKLPYENFTIPKGIKKIGYGAFYKCESLIFINIPDSMIEIGGWAFAYCTSLASIIIPDSVNRIEDSVFNGCTEDLVIKCKQNSYADKYAKEYKIEVEYI